MAVLNSRDIDPSDYHGRLKQIFSNEIRLQNREATISKRSSRCLSNLIVANEAIERQQRDFGKLRIVLMKRSQELERRFALGEALKQQLDATRQHNADMQAQLLRHTTEVKLRSNELMECMHTLKQATGTYINHEALPARLKGISVVRAKDGATKWIPFDLDGNETNGLHTLWRCLHTRSDNASKWRQLLSVQEVAKTAPVTPCGNQRAKSRCSNVVPTSIIEIDLTSPTNDAS
ncbi:kinetochore protein Spc25-like [Drosophila obscura]|uniref:kinetochore protein Spc25-like n=1 Tax=Drosophila obscura TaxID=7282 RepID=UPI001BB2343E|nr:kinetochore protein Spc25-like [Drosophila obscura]